MLARPPGEGRNHGPETDFPAAAEQLELVGRGVVDFHVRSELEERLEASCTSSRKPLRIKAGFDPTRPDLHLDESKVELLKRDKEAGRDPREIKALFGRKIVERFHGKEAAEHAAREFKIRVNA